MKEDSQQKEDASSEYSSGEEDANPNEEH